ncbi:hypothetical protein lbkm_0930 [Lachnospiraceae bacterium KM106-2]|nr:hypothetical protein lbkm_0930 [Lachnospiraceae bacterium KM106-2]
MNDKEEQLFAKRLLELANSAYYKGIPKYTDFMNLNEISIFLSMLKELPKIDYRFEGGYDGAERKILSFYQKESYIEPEFDIAILEIKPLNAKFSDDLTHRDYLGAILNLGIDRSKTGDILLMEDKTYLFCDGRIATFLTDSLCKIKHTNVSCRQVDHADFHYEPKFEQISGSISSERIDCVIPLAFKGSRSGMSHLIAAGKVYVNGKLMQSNSYQLKEDDVISVRGYGKFIYKGYTNQTKKGRFYATLLKYI